MRDLRTPFRGFVYELRRVLVSIPLLVIMALIVLASIGVLASVSQTTSPLGLYATVSGAYYYSQGDFHFEFYAYDAYAHPYSEVRMNVSFYQTSNGSYLESAYSTTGSDGLANVSIAFPTGRYNISISADDQRHDLQGYYDGENIAQNGYPYALQLFYGSVSPAPQRVALPLFEVANDALTSNNFNNQIPLLQVFYSGPNGTLPPDYKAYWAGPFKNTGQSPEPLPEQSMHFLGTLTTIHQTYSLSVPNATYAGFGGLPIKQVLQVEIFTSSGEFLAQDTNVSAGVFAPSGYNARSLTSSTAFSFAEGVLGFLVSLMAIVAAYTAYGKDRVSGVLESTLCGPVSREGLTLSRYFAVVGTLGIAICIDAGVINILLQWSLGAYLQFSVSLLLVGGLVVEVAIFTGLVFMASRFLRSTASLMGLAVGLLALFDVAWLFLIPLIQQTEFSQCTTATCNSAGNVAIQLDFLNPAQFMRLVDNVYFAANIPGVTTSTVVITALMWLLIPLIILVFHVRTRD